MTIDEFDIATEYTNDPDLVNEVESVGNSWIICVYTDELSKWKKEWKLAKALGGEKTINPLIYTRTEKDGLLFEGSIKHVSSFAKVDEATNLFSDLNGPMNSDWDNQGQLVVPCSQAIQFVDVSTRKTNKIIVNKLFNDLHCVSVNKTTGRILVTSSGPGKVLEVDADSKQIVWEWDADDFIIKNGKVDDSILKAREQYFIENVDYRTLKMETSGQVTHVNTATWIDDYRIGVSFFHQGYALVVNRETNRVDIILKNLKKPHGFQPCVFKGKQHYAVTDTGNGAIWIIDKDLKPTTRIRGFFHNHPYGETSWLHTTFAAGDKLIAIDQTQAQIILLDPDSKRKQIIQHDPDWKISYISRI